MGMYPSAGNGVNSASDVSNTFASIMLQPPPMTFSDCRLGTPVLHSAI